MEVMVAMNWGAKVQKGDLVGRFVAEGPMLVGDVVSRAKRDFNKAFPSVRRARSYDAPDVIGVVAKIVTPKGCLYVED